VIRKRFRFQLKFKLSFRFSGSAKFLSDQVQSSDLFPKLIVSNDYIYKLNRIAFSVLFAKWLTIFSSTYVSEQI